MRKFELVIPYYNPAPGMVSNAVEKFLEFTGTLPDWEGQLILVDDGSDAPTRLDLPGNVRMLRYEKNKGKGYALRHGISHCGTNYILYTDIDLPYTFESMKNILKALEDGTNVALGFRKRAYYNQVPWFRRQLSKAFRLILKYLLNSEITDTQCGLKGMDPEGKAIFLRTDIDRFLVDMEFVRLCSIDPSIIIEGVPVVLRPDVQFSKMGVVTLVKESGNFWKVLLK